MISEAIHHPRRVLKILCIALVLFFILQPAILQAFEGRINATITQGNQSQALLYTAGTNYLRVELTATNWPNPVDIVDRNSGALTLLFPHNRSFVRLKAVAENVSSPAGFPRVPAGLPSGIVSQLPQSPRLPAMPAASAMPTMPSVGGMPSMPAMPMMPMPGEAIELKSTGEKTNLLGFACEKFEIKQRREIMDIWATDKLLPFQDYVRNQSPRFGPRMIEEQWAGLLVAKKLFPLRASLHFENSPDRYRFEVQSVTPQKFTDEDGKLFQPPDGYIEIEPLPF